MSWVCSSGPTKSLVMHVDDVLVKLIPVGEHPSTGHAFSSLLHRHLKTITWIGEYMSTLHIHNDMLFWVRLGHIIITEMKWENSTSEMNDEETGGTVEWARIPSREWKAQCLTRECVPHYYLHRPTHPHHIHQYPQLPGNPPPEERPGHRFTETTKPLEVRQYEKSWGGPRVPP